MGQKPGMISRFMLRKKKEFFFSFLTLPKGIASHDTFNRGVSAIDPDQFEFYFIEQVAALATIKPKEGVNIDAKTIREAKFGGKKSAIHMVSAWAAENNLV